MKALLIAATMAFMLCAGSASVRGQTYQFDQTGQHIVLTALDVNGENVQALGSLEFTNSSFSSSVTLDQTTGNVRESGTIWVPGATQSFTITKSLTISFPPVFPNPPHTETFTGDLTVTLTSSGATMAFDTGPRAMSYEQGTLWGINNSFGFELPVNVSYSLVTDGMTYSGSSLVQMPMSIDLSATDDVANYPQAIFTLAASDFHSIAEFDCGGVTAPNGLEAHIYLTPEPSVVTLGGLCAGAILMLRYRRSGH